MRSPQSLAQRVDTLEAQMSGVKETLDAHSESLYRLERKTTRMDLNMLTILNHLGLTAATEEEVDAELDKR